MRVALVHDWLTGMRGGERVLEQMCLLFPDAKLFTLIHDPGSVSAAIESMPIRTSFLNRLPGIERYYRYLLPLYPLAASSMDLRGFDLILSSSHAAAKAVRRPDGALHICYCHTPMRYIWDGQGDYFRYGSLPAIRRAALSTAAPLLRAWDRRAADRVHCFLANSAHVKERIARCYGRRAEVLYPPVDTGFFTPASNGIAPSYYLVVSALVSHKRIDIAIEAFNRLGLPLVIVGAGPDMEALRRRAAKNIEFKGFVSDEELRSLYRRCRGLVVPGREDFGLTAVEAQACGRPVVAYAAGGSLESVSDGETGVFFEPQTSFELEKAIRRLERLRLDPDVARARAERFSADRFRRDLQTAVRQAVQGGAAPARMRGAAEPLPLPGGIPQRDAAPAHPSITGIRGFVKRGLDVIISISLLLLLGPLLMALAWRITRETPGPGLFRQTRLGHGGREFRMIKLRTMRRDAEADGVPVWAVDGDSRCTPTGSLLRSSGIDELPQLWNVLKGEMSLVGPRPERPGFHAAFALEYPEFARRLEVRGGITGLAQIRGWRGNTSIEKRLRSDIEYLDRWSLGRDLWILMRTLAEIRRVPQPVCRD